MTLEFSRLATSRIWLLTLVMATMPILALSAPRSVEVADFRGGDDIIVTGPDFLITEREAFLFAVMTDLFDPELMTRWRELSDTEKFIVRENLTFYIQAIYNARLADDNLSARQIELATKARRVFSGPAALHLWADYVVRDTIRIFPEDIIHYYLDNKELFAEPESVRVLRLRVPMSTSPSRSEQEAALARAEALRRRAIFEGGLAPILQEYPDLMIDPPGRTVEYIRGEQDDDILVTSEAFRMTAGQISQPIRLPGGFVLVEVLERQAPEPMELNEALAEVKSTLQQNFIPQQFDYLIAEEIERSLALSRAHLYEFMPEEAAIVQVRRFQLLRREFRQLYPEIIGDEEMVNKPAILLKAGEIMSGEIATQDLEKRGLDRDPFYQEALQMADMFQRMATYLRERRAEIDPTMDEIREYLEENREELEPGSAKDTWKLSFIPRDAERMSAAELNSMQIVMSSYMEEFLGDARRQFRERRQIAGDRGLLEPDKVVRNLREPDDQRVTTRFEYIGGITRLDSRQRIGVVFEELELGEFTAPKRERNGVVASYYVSRITTPPPVPEGTLLRQAREQLIVDRSVELVRGQVDDMRQDGTIRFAPELEDDTLVPAGGTDDDTTPSTTVEQPDRRSQLSTPQLVDLDG